MHQNHPPATRKMIATHRGIHDTASALRAEMAAAFDAKTMTEIDAECKARGISLTEFIAELMPAEEIRGNVFNLPVPQLVAIALAFARQANAN